jgi:hypothetical protein
MGHEGENRIAEDYGNEYSLEVLADWVEKLKPCG